MKPADISFARQRRGRWGLSAASLAFLAACGGGPAQPSAPAPEAILETTGSGLGPYVVVYDTRLAGRGSIEVFAAETCEAAGLTLDFITHPVGGGRAIYECREAFR